MRPKLIAIFLIVFSFFLISTQSVFAEEVKEVKLTVTDDTYISQSSPDSINGNKTFLTAAAQPQDNRLILLKFSTAQVPKGSVIGSATLLMTSYSCSGADTTPVLQLNYALDDWNEDTARWTGKPRTGLDVAVIDASPTIKSFNVTSAVNKWVQGTTTNNGFIVSFQGGPYTCNFYSKERTTDSINLIVKFIPPDTTKPTISQVATSNITTTGATITWTTNEESTSYVDYYVGSSVTGLVPTIKSVGQNNSTKTHSVTLNELSSGKKYYFRVRSKDIAGNEATSSYASFTTKSAFIVVPTIKVNISPLVIQNALEPGVVDSSVSPTEAPTQTPTPTAEVVEDQTSTSSEAAENEVIITPDAQTLQNIEKNQEQKESTKESEKKNEMDDIYPVSPTYIIIILLVIIMLLIVVLIVVLANRKAPQEHRSKSVEEKTVEK
jgi:hypothetical protein